MHENTFSMGRSAGRTDRKPSFDRGNGRFRDRTPCNSPSSAKTASSSGFDGDYRDKSNNMGQSSTCGMGFMKGHKRGRNSLRSRRSDLNHLKPLSSMESCLMAQLYNEHAEMEDVLAPLPSPCTPALRPFFVTDGTQIIKQSSCHKLSLQVRDGEGKSHLKFYPEANETVFGGIRHLPELRSEEGSREKNPKRRKDQNKKLCSSRRKHNEMQTSSQGSQSNSVVFCLGVSFGIISSILANKAEAAKLHDLLKQTESLVQDLQEELEMKESLTVKELVNKDDVFPCVDEDSIDKKKPNEPLVHSDSDVLIKYGVEGYNSQKATETIESMSTIEAELEAELERLELNMTKSTMNERLSDDDEVDPDLVVEVIQGELRADLFSCKTSSDLSLDHGSSSSLTPCSPKQGVSPHELTLKLHQVIQSRLEQRIAELESALEESEKRVSQLQSKQQRSSSWRGFSTTDMSSSSFSTQGSPTTIGGSTPVENGIENGSFLCQPVSTDPETPRNGGKMIEQSEKFCLNENEDEDDDMTLLIMQIVEKTRQGSPAVLHAQRALFCLDKNEE